MSVRRPEHPGRVLTVGVLVLAGITLAILAGTSQRNGPAEVKRPDAIVMLSPNEGDLVVPQSTIGAQVRTDFTAQIIVNSRVIPQDQLSGDPNLGEFYFDPGPGKEYRELPKGNNFAEVQWWPREIPTPEEAGAKGRLGHYSWAFKVG